MVTQTFSDAEVRMKKAVEVLRKDLATIRTGRASPALVEHIPVAYYGAMMPLNQLAGISVPEARLLTIQPWDKQSLPHIEKAILQANIGLNPSNDGTVIRIPIPPLTEERRRELAKVVHHRVEEGRVGVRNVRRDALDQIRNLKKNKDISEDEERRAEERLQKLTDEYIQNIHQLGQDKEKELMES